MTGLNPRAPSRGEHACVDGQSGTTVYDKGQVQRLEKVAQPVAVTSNTLLPTPGFHPGNPWAPHSHALTILTSKLEAKGGRPSDSL